MNAEELRKKEEQLSARLVRLSEMEAEILKRERAARDREKAKKQVLLRLAPSLWDEIAQWADEDFRSINSQIEYLLSEAVRQRKKN